MCPAGPRRPHCGLFVEQKSHTGRSSELEGASEFSIYLFILPTFSELPWGYEGFVDKQMGALSCGVHSRIRRHAGKQMINVRCFHETQREHFIEDETETHTPK